MNNSWYRFNRLEKGVGAWALVGSGFGVWYMGFLLYLAPSWRSAPGFTAFLLLLFSLMTLVGGMGVFRLQRWGAYLYSGGTLLLLMIYAVSPVAYWVAPGWIFWIHSPGILLFMMFLGLPKIRSLLSAGGETSVESEGTNPGTPVPEGVSWKFLIACFMLSTGPLTPVLLFPGMSGSLHREYLALHQARSDISIIKSRLSRAMEGETIRLGGDRSVRSFLLDDRTPEHESLQVSLTDPWGSPYRVVIPGKKKETTVESLRVYSEGPRPGRGPRVKLTWLDRILNRITSSPDTES